MNIIKETRNDNGELHSFNDEPAVIDSDGTKFWYTNGKRHRGNDLPATIHSNGSQFWYMNGLLHREKDAAAIYEDGTKHWYMNGKYYTFHEWLKLTPLSEEQKLYLVLEHEYN